MNKKFSTLLVGAMLASAMSVGAQTEVQKYESNKTYLLGDGVNFISVVADPDAGDYGKLVSLPAAQVKATIQNTSNSLWSVTVTQGANGNAPKFTYVNKATGLTLAVDASKLDKDTPSVPAVIGGATSEWLNTVLTDAGSGKKLQAEVLRSYLNANTVAYLESTPAGLVVKKAAANAVPANAFKVAPYEAALVTNIDAEALNSQLGTAPEGWFNLSFDKDVTSKGSNLFANTALKAVNVRGTKYVMLMAKDKKAYDKQAYIVADTLYHSGTESVGQLVKFAYANVDEQTEGKGANKLARLPEAYMFDFDYSPSDERLIIKVRNYKKKGTKVPVDGVDGAYTEWSENVGATDDYYLRLATLTTARELTIASEASSVADAATTPGWNDKANGMLTKVSIGISANAYVPTTLAEGIYMIQLRTSGYNKRGYERTDQSDGDYFIANLAGDFKYMPQQRNQNFDHMPAAHWVVKKNSSSATSPVTIQNREFDDLLTISGQLFKAGDNKFFVNQLSGDTLDFIPVSKESVENDKLGYKYVTELDTDVERYLFNYLHGLADDKFLSVPSDKDSIVRVDENGTKSSFRLEIAVKDDKYGYDDKLVRNVYRIVDNWGRSLGYDQKTKKYVLSETAYGTYFLKENNDKSGKHFYTIIPANLYYGVDKEGKSFIAVKDQAIKNYASGTESEVSFRSNDYASSKLSVDDNTLDLVNGDINDKFISGNFEARNSAFSVEIDDAPLYRRFNIKALGESETDGAQCLAFVENVRREYLMDEMNPNLQDKKVDYAGIWNAEQAKGKLFFHVDTAWVKRGLGEIKPQYLISVARNDQEGVATEPCTEAGPHIDADGHITDDPYKCVHATRGKLGFVYGKYMVNFSDSAQVLVDAEAKKNPYMVNSQNASNNSYTRVGFVPAIKVGDSLVVLTNGFEKMEPAKLDTAEIYKNYRANKLTHFIVDLTGDKHKNVTWSFRYVNPETALKATENNDANAFLIESNVYSFDYDNDNADDKYRTVIGDSNLNRAIAPTYGAAWLKMHNGCLVLTDNGSQFDVAKTNNDGALVFNVEQMAEGDEFVTSNDEIAAEGIAIVAGNGTVTIQGAAGKSVVITNILGKVVAETVLTSDNATIAVLAGIVAVAVDGEEAVKAIVK